MAKNTGLIVYSQYMDRQMMNNYPAGDAVRHQMGRSDQAAEGAAQGHRRQVAVYPYGGMQHQEIELDG